MYQISSILVPVDFSETSATAVNQAVSMAKLLKAKLYLLNVVEILEPYFLSGKDLDASKPVSADLLGNEARKGLEKLAAGILQNTDIAVNTDVVRSPDIHEAIIDYSKKNAVDLIVMGTHGISGFNELFIGSNAHRVVTLSHIPVLTLQNDASSFKNILVPIDNSIHSREKVNIAAKIASIYQSKVHVIGLPDDDDEEEINKFRIKLKSVEEIIVSQNLECVSSIVNGENLAKVALTYAADNGCDLIIINTGHESKITGIFLGVFAQQIVNHSVAPVLSFRHQEDHFSIITPGFGI